MRELKHKKITALVLTVFLLFTFVLTACSKDSGQESTSAKSITINGATEIDSISSEQYSAVIANSEAGDTVVWSLTSGSGIAELSAEGLLTARNVGKVKIKATLSTDSNISKELEVDIIDAQSQNVAFANMEEGKFYVGEEEFTFLGNNSYTMHYKSEAMIDDLLDRCVDMGVKVFRMWGFFDGWQDEGRANYTYLQTQPNVYTSPEELYGETLYDREDPTIVRESVDAREVMDYTIKRAGQKGIRLIIVLTNYYPEFGGMQQYVAWHQEQVEAGMIDGPPASSKHDFYTNETIKTWYKNYVNHIITRENTLTGVAYKDDPTIFAWELANEPEGGTELLEWTDEMSTYVKSIDKNHMVSSGIQGGIESAQSIGELGSATEVIEWDSNGDGVDDKSYTLDRNDIIHSTRYNVNANNDVSLERHLMLDNIDFGTIHLYPDHWGINRDIAIEYGEKYIKDSLALGHKHDKPVVLEEYGSMIPTLTESKRFSRELAYENWNKAIVDMDGPGSMIWTMTGIDDSEGADAQGLYPNYDGFRILDDGSEAYDILHSYAQYWNGEIDEIDRSTPKVYWRNPLLSEVVKTYQEDSSAVSVVYNSSNDMNIEISVIPNGKIVESVQLYVTNNSSDPNSTAVNGSLLTMTAHATRANVYYNRDLNLTDLAPGEIYTVKAVANFTDGTELDLPARNIKRYIKLELDELKHYEFGADEDVYFMTFGSYLATLNSIVHNKTDGVMQLDVIDGDHWSEHKVKFIGFPQTSEGKPMVAQTFRVQFTLYYEYDASLTGKLKPYIALEPGWLKIDTDKHTVDVSNILKNYDGTDATLGDPLDPSSPYGVTKKQLSGNPDKLWIYQTVTIEFTPNDSINSIVINPTTEYLKTGGSGYAGYILIDDFILYGYEGDVPVDVLDPDDFEIPDFEW